MSERSEWRWHQRNNVGRRVHDKVQGDYGTIIERVTRDYYRVAWDRPTPHEATATPHIPSKFFEWASPTADA